MKPEEVNAMTDEQLRVKAAELMGAKWYICKGVRILEFGRPLGWHESTEVEMRFPLGEEWDSNIPDYPNEIAAAWPLTEAVPGARFAVYQMDHLADWTVNVMKGYYGEETWKVLAEFTDRPTSRAITKAFILAMTVDEK